SVASGVEASRAPVVIQSRKARALVAYLAMHPGEPIDRERLANLLWGDVADADARHNLRQCIVTLKKLSPDLLTVRRTSIAFAIEPAAVDAHCFVMLATERHFAAAAALYRGEFLSTMHLDDDAYQEWAYGERNRIAAVAALVFQCLVDERDAV